MVADARRNQEVWVDPRAWRIKTAFGSGAAMGIVGRIQNRRFGGDKAVVYGIEFAGGALAHLDAVIARLERTHVRLR